MFDFNNDEDNEKKEPKKDEFNPGKLLLDLLKKGVDDGKVEIHHGSEMPEGLRRLLEGDSKREGKGRTPERVIQSTRENAKRLKELFAEYSKPQKLEVGQLVQWKAGMRNRKVPEYGVPAIVWEELPPGHMDEGVNSGDIAYREPLTHRIGFIDERDGDLLVFTYDGSRFEPYQG